VEKISLEVTTASEAAQAMTAAGLRDTHGQFTPESIASSGQAFKLTTAGGTGVFVAEKRGNHLWIHGAGGVKTSGLTADGLGVIEALAREIGVEFVAFETKRPGLTRLAKKAGYSVNAVIMTKRVTP
jgi:hypothetical protein